MSLISRVANGLVIAASALCAAAAMAQSNPSECQSKDAYTVTCSYNQAYYGAHDGSNGVRADKDLEIFGITVPMLAVGDIPIVEHYAAPGSGITQIKATIDTGTFQTQSGGRDVISVGGDGASGKNDLTSVTLHHRGNILIPSYGEAGSAGIRAFSNGGGNGGPSRSNFDVSVQAAINSYAPNTYGVLLLGKGGDGSKGADKGYDLSPQAGGAGGRGGVGPAFSRSGAPLRDGSVSPTGGLFASGAVTVNSYASLSAPGVVMEGSGGAGGAGGTGGYYCGDYGTCSGNKGGAGGAGGDANSSGIGFTLGQHDAGSWTVATWGAKSDAIRVQGIGGAGGAGGKSQYSGGGAGGDGGRGADLELWTYPSQATYSIVSTRGDMSAGLLAVSGGGIGGVGGLGTAGAHGGSGGAGGHISLGLLGGHQHYADTLGKASPGILLHSDGGDGGAGGAGGGGSGGDGAEGGPGGDITVFSAVSSTTRGDNSHAFAAYSTGGGGGTAGNGGFIFSDNGTGGAASTGGAVDIQLWAGNLATFGDASDGVVAQSIGGHSGAATDCYGLVCFGASGGSAGAAGNVAVKLTDGSITIDTAGESASGVVAYSIGGGGGDGNSAADGANSFGLFYAKGGKGGNGGAGAEVYVWNQGVITTAGNDSNGIDAKSIGGAGGRGGGAGALGAFGARGGGSSNAGPVSVFNWNRINAGAGRPGGELGSTDDENKICGEGCSHGIIAQSIGGGGGQGGWSGGSFASIGGSGSSGGDGGAVLVQTYGSGFVTTHLDHSEAIYAQSLGGGGGKAGGTIAVSGGESLVIGGSGSKGGHGGTVQVDLLAGAQLTTFGEDSTAIKAMSLGGGGGTGAYAISVSVSKWAGGAAAVGGGGGGGGNADAVTVSTDAGTAITTHGDTSPAIDAQSTGGNGGAGGFAISAEGGNSIASASVAVGGAGGEGGDGGIVTVTNGARIGTDGDEAHGVAATSHGGGGGYGRFAIAGDVNVGSGATVAVSVGGAGGAGGVGRDVIVDNTGVIGTKGDDAHGVYAQSLGGGGGYGGLAISGSINTGGKGGGALDVSVGGSGGGGGDAGDVTVTNSAAIATTGMGARGLVASSVGGGGGVGRMSFSGSAQIANKNSAAVNVSIGGSGGTAGDGGAVQVRNIANITTGVAALPAATDLPPDNEGSILTNAHAIFAQSAGKGGGDGGFAGTADLGVGGGEYNLSVGYAQGGKGGGGGAGGDVLVTSGASAVLTTYYDESVGILAQSVGGGGGFGGMAFSGTQEIGSGNDSSTVNFEFAWGGDGGAGNHGAAVNVTSDSRIETWGDHSHGIFAQSVGGGGGAGGTADTYVSNLKCYDPGNTVAGVPFPFGCSSKQNVSVALAMGGNGGDTNSGQSRGGSVEVSSTGAISTRGSNATAIFAQSIGAGGGDGGHSATLGLPVPLTDRSEIYTSLSAAVGGNGGVSGDGGDVSVTHRGGTLSATGTNSAGVFAQSVGGGGGRGGTGSVGATGTVDVGGAGGAAGHGGDVTVDVSADIITGTPPSPLPGDVPDGYLKMPDASYGIFAHSVGGGGGVAGDATLCSLCVGYQDYQGLNSIGIGLEWLREGGNAGDGGVVSVRASGAITTYSDSAVGIFAQSVGGGGGVAGNTGLSESIIFQSLWGSAGGDGIGQAVAVNYDGKLVTTGDGATGIFAQSAGGLAPLTASGAAVDVTVSGSVVVSGDDASAILVQSAALSLQQVADGGPPIKVPVGADTITVTIGEDSFVQGGRPGGVQAGAGVEFRDGVNNSLVNYGEITSLGGVAVAQSGNRYTPGSGTLTIHNYGRIDGDVQGQQDGAVTVNNYATGVMNTGALMQLGVDGVLRNDGRVNIGGDRKLATSVLGGSFVQTGTGVLWFDLAHASDPLAASRADRLLVENDAVLAGVIDLNILELGIAGLGRQTITLIQSGGALDMEALSMRPSAVAQYALEKGRDGRVVLSYDIDFQNAAVLAELNGNNDAIASHLADLHGSARIDDLLLPLLQAENAAAYGDALEGFSPAPYGVNGAATVMSSMLFGDSLMGCGRREGEFRFIRQGDCAWLDGSGRRYSRDEFGDAGYDINFGGLSFGAQTEVAEDWHAGFGLAYERMSGSSDRSLWDSEGEQFMLGAGVQHRIGATLLAASLSGSHGDYDVDRTTASGLRASGNQDIWLLGGQLRAAHLIERDGWYIKPSLDLSSTYFSADDVTEKGAGAANLHVDGEADFQLAVRPAVLVGYELQVGAGYILRPRVTVRLTQYLTDPSQDVTARFLDAGGIGSDFTVESGIDRTAVDLAIGMDVFSVGGAQISAEARTEFSEHATSYGAGLRIRVPF